MISISAPGLRLPSSSLSCFAPWGHRRALFPRPSYSSPSRPGHAEPPQGPHSPVFSDSVVPIALAHRLPSQVSYLPNRIFTASVNTFRVTHRRGGSTSQVVGGSDGKESAWFHPWVGKIPWRRKWQPTPVFSPGESHGQRSLAGYGSWGPKESDTAEWLALSARTYSRA